MSILAPFHNFVLLQGTADAVRQYLWLLEEQNVLEYLVLAGDHLYRMDYQRFIKCHRENNADITIAALPMDEKRATAFGLMKIDETGRITEFAEKPKGEALKKMQVRWHDSNSMMLIGIWCHMCFFQGSFVPDRRYANPRR